MDKQYFSDLGKDLGQNISNAVHNAVNTRDMQNLGRSIDDVISEVRHTVQNVMAQQPFDASRGKNEHPYVGPSCPGANREQQREQQRAYRQEQRREARNGTAQQYNNQNNPYQPPYQYDWRRGDMPSSSLQTRRKPAQGNTSGVLMTIFGCALTIPLSLVLVIGAVLLVLNSMFSALFWLAVGVTPFLAAGIALSCRGGQLRGRFHRCKEYLRIAGNAGYIKLEELASAIGKPKNYITSDLRKMIKVRLLPQAHIDEQETCLMLDDSSYKQYLASQEALRQRQAEETARQTQEQSDPASAELRKAIEEGRSYIRQIKEANDAIANEDISQLLNRLEAITTRIFSHVESRPQKLPEINKFMRYYLPTTLKLVNAYREFENQPVQGENITASKQEIQSALSTINDAFENLLDSLFQNDAMDISADISVLNAMLAQEGLTGSEFKMPKTADKPAEEKLAEEKPELKF